MALIKTVHETLVLVVRSHENMNWHRDMGPVEKYRNGLAVYKTTVYRKGQEYVSWASSFQINTKAKLLQPEKDTCALINSFNFFHPPFCRAQLYFKPDHLKMNFKFSTVSLYLA